MDSVDVENYKRLLVKLRQLQIAAEDAVSKGDMENMKVTLRWIADNLKVYLA
jgi:hypothetical protein